MIGLSGRRPGTDGAWLRETLPFVAIFLLVFGANIAASMLSGRLAAPPGYDDVLYLSDALDRVAFAPGSGFVSLLASFWNNPPHAPLMTLVGMAGYGLLGPADISAYIANGWALALYIAFMAWLARPLGSLPARVMLVAILAYVPVAHILVSEFRPDPVSGLIFAIAIWTVCRTDFRSASTGRLALAMALGVAATVAKPTGFVVSIPGFGIATAATIISQGIADRIADRPAVARLARRALVAALLYVLMLAPFAIVFGPKTVAYVSSVLFTNADVWTTPGDRWFHLTFHLSGPGGLAALGPFGLIAVVLVAVDLVLYARRPTYRRPEMLPFAATLVVLYAAMSSSNEKTVFQGCFFYLPLLVAAVSALVRMISAASIGPRALSIGLGALLILCMATLPVVTGPDFLIDDGADAARLRPLAAEAIMRVYTEEIAGAECADYVPTIAVTYPRPLTAEAIGMAMARRGVRTNARRIAMLRFIGHVTKAVGKVDFVLTTEPSAADAYRRLPGGKLIPQTFAWLSSQQDMQKIAIGSYHGQTYWLFARPLCKSSTHPWDQPPPP